jgi:hypothetical protein
MIRIILASVLALSAGPAFAKTTFFKYEGRPQIRDGDGGVKQTNRGIDVWVQGSPPRKYEIIGTLVDDRDMGDGDALTSKKVAKTVREAGGDALMLTDQQSATTGMMAGSAGNFAWAAPVGRASTYFVVIRYTTDAK